MPNPEPHTPSHKPTPTTDRLFVGLTVGLMLGAAFSFYGAGYLAEDLSDIATALLIALTLSCSLILTLYLIRNWLFKQLLQTSAQNLQELTTPLIHSIQAASQRDSDQAFEKSGELVRGLVGLYS